MHMVGMPKIGDLLKNLKGMSLNQSEISVSDVAQLAEMLIAYVGLGQPDVLVGPVPLYNCTFFDVSISQDVLKFRAVEAQFLAHQPATSYAMRIDFVLQEKYAWIISYLQAMYYLGGPIRAFFGPEVKKLPVPKINLASDTNVFPEPYKYGKPLSEEEYNKRMSPDTPIEEKVEYWEEGTARLTFPVISDSFIFFNMYIESLFWTKNVEEGHVVKGTILLRKYIPPPKKIIYAQDVEETFLETTIGSTGQRPADTTVTVTVRNKPVDKKLKWKYEFEYTQPTGAYESLVQRIFGAVTRKSKSLKPMEELTFTYPTYRFNPNGVKYSLGESNRYAKMVDFVYRDTMKQFIFYLLSEAKNIASKPFNGSLIKRMQRDEYISAKGGVPIHESDFDDEHISPIYTTKLGKGGSRWPVPDVDGKYYLYYNKMRFLTLDIPFETRTAAGLKYRSVDFVSIVGSNMIGGKYYFKCGTNNTYILVNVTHVMHDSIDVSVRVARS